MSKYTTEIRFLCESLTGLTESKGYNDTRTIIDNAKDIIFDFDFPIFDEAYRGTLETKILRHYYTREISEETYGLWKLRLEDRMNIIMPYYNKLYESELLKFNPLYDVDLTTKHEGSDSGFESNDSELKNKNKMTENRNENEDINESNVKTGDRSNELKTNNVENNAHTGDITDVGNVKNDYQGETSDVSNTESAEKTKQNGNNSNDSNNTQWTLFSDTPQGGLNGIEGFDDDIQNNTYLTNATKVTNNAHEEGENSTTGEANQYSTGVSNGNESFVNNETSNGTKTFDENNEITERRNENSNENYNEVNNNDIGRERKENNESNVEGISTRIDNRTSMTTDEYLQHVVGKSGGVSYSSLILEFRETFINIDEMIIEELHDLFFGLW